MQTARPRNGVWLLLGEVMVSALIAGGLIGCPGSSEPGAGTETGAASDSTTSAGSQTTDDAGDGTLISSDDPTEVTETTDPFNGSGPYCMYADWKCTSNASCDNECARGGDISWCQPTCQQFDNASDWATWCEDYTKWYPQENLVPAMTPGCRENVRCDGVTPCAELQQRISPNSDIALGQLRCVERALRYVDTHSDGVGGVCMQVCSADSDCIDFAPGISASDKACRRLAETTLISAGAPGEPARGIRYKKCAGECVLSTELSVKDGDATIAMPGVFPPLFAETPCTPGAITILEEPATPTAGR